MAYTPLVDTVFTGNPRVPTAAPGDNDTSAANTAFVTAALGFYVPKAGGVTITGDITFGTNADIIMDNTSVLTLGDVTISRVSADILTLGSGDQLRVQQDPVNDNDLVRKVYVDNIAAGLDTKASVKVATTGNITLSAPQTIDGVSVIAGDRVLVRAQTSAVNNGIYVVAAGAWTRSTDFDGTPAQEVSGGAYTFVEQGTLYADTGWVVTSNGTRVVGTDTIDWTQFSSATIVATLDSLTDVSTAGVVAHALLRYDGSGWVDTEGMLYDETTDRLELSGTGASSGLLIGGDVSLYRASAGELKTGASVAVTVGLDVETRTGVTGERVLVGQVTAGKGGLKIGTANDTNLYRDSAAVLKTDAAFTSVGIVTATAGATSPAAYTSTGATGGFVTTGAAPLTIASGVSTLGGRVIMSAGQRVAVSAVKTAAYTVALATDHIIRCDSSGGAFTVTLPAGHVAGDTVVIKDVTGSAEAFPVTIDPNSTETIDGLTTFVLNVNRQAVMAISDGTNWVIV